jgi:Carboxypeptidase regulatory-like domain
MFKSPSSARAKALSIATVVAVLAVFGIAAGGASTAVADSTASISGTVYSATSGEPLANVFVSLDLPGGNYVQFGNTNSTGAYSFVGLAPASYVINFAPGYGDNYAQQWWNDKPTLATATPIPVAAGQAVTGINASLVDGATVTGNVQTSTGPGAFFSVAVLDASGNFISSSGTDSNGNYTISQVPAGSYTVQFTSPINASYPAQWWNDESSLATANFFTTTAGGTTTDIDASFAVAASGSVSGTVYDSSTPGVGLANAGVQAYTSDGTFVGSTSTSANGSFTLTGLAPGSYKLQYLPGFLNGNLAIQYWQDEPSLASADTFTISAGDALTGYDAHLAVGGTISGTVLDGAGANAPIANVDVTVYQNGVLVPTSSFSQTDNDGNYALTGLAAGTYDVFFQPGYPSTDATQWWSNAASEASATHVTVTAGTTVSGINATLHGGGTISGVVSGKATNGTLFPAGNSQLAVYAADGSLVSDAVYADDSGSFSISNLAPGAYKIHVDPQPDTNDFVPQWWNNKPTETAATAIIVKAGQTKVVNPTLASTALKPATPHVSGSTKVGSTLTVKPGIWHPGTVSLSYQWLRNDVPVAGATAANYPLTNADANAKITVAVTGAEAGYTTDTVTSAPTRAVTGGVLSTGVPTIQGTPAVGQVLTASPGTWGPGTVNLTYKWFRGSARIAGATSSSYTLEHSDAGKTIIVKVTGAAPGFTTATVASAPTAAVH